MRSLWRDLSGPSHGELPTHVLVVTLLLLVQDPRLLPCLHSFCSRCVPNMINRDGEVVCDECGVQHTLDSDQLSRLPVDGQLESQVHHAKAKGAARCGNCERRHRCNPNPNPNPGVQQIFLFSLEAADTGVSTHRNRSTLHCLQCATDLCKSCFRDTHTAPMFKKHKVVYVEHLGQGEEGCGTHHKPWNYYCHKCDKLLCDSCFVSGVHTDHIDQVMQT